MQLTTIAGRPVRRTVQLDPVAISAAFEQARTQSDWMVALYRMVFPDWDAIKQVEGWPACSDRTWKHIAQLAIDWENARGERTPDGFLRYMPGGAWLNSGFTTGGGLKPFEVDLTTCTVHY